MKPSFLLLIVLSACHISNKQEHQEEIPTPPKSAEQSFRKTAKKEALFGITDSLSDFSFKEDFLFGKFHSDRVEFHVLEQPGLKLFNSNVDKLTLYFIDGYLCKKKYEMAQDISKILILKHGKFKVQPLNWQTRDFVKAFPELIMNNPGAEPRGIAARTNVAALNKL
ncbi:MAG: hypothetical protein ACI9GZ_001736 [Bacteroidia bacterium]|jgi:hypothetical protein